MRPEPGSEVDNEVQWGEGRGRRGQGETGVEKVELHESEKTLSAKTMCTNLSPQGIECTPVFSGILPRGAIGLSSSLAPSSASSPSLSSNFLSSSELSAASEECSSSGDY